MKNKLLLTSALISGLSVIGSAALAETKITGDMKLGYKSGDAVGGVAGTPGRSGFFRESQLNIASKGTLNNGLNYTAGFSFESDGGDSAGAQNSTGTNAKSIVTSNEGYWIGFGAGNTSIEFGLDHAPNIDQSPTPRVAENAATALGGTVSSSASAYANAFAEFTFSQSLLTPKENMSVAVIQKTPYGQFSINYVPNVSNSGASDTALDQGLTAGGQGNSAYEAVFRGKPVANIPLDILVARTVEHDAVASGGLSGVNTSSDRVTTTLAAGYNFGKFAIGGDRRKTADFATGGIDRTQIEFSATAALSDNVSIGIGDINIEKDGTTQDEEIQYLQIGYNMGAVFASFGMFDVENGRHQAANDGKLYSARIGTKF